MIKKFIFCLMLLVIGAALVFYDQVLDVFRGMTVLESLRTIVQFVLHYTVATLATWALYMALEILEPVYKLWRTVLRQKRRDQRRRRVVQQVKARRQAVNSLSRIALPRTRGVQAQAMMWLIQQLAKRSQSRGASSTSGQTPLSAQREQPVNRIRLKF